MTSPISGDSLWAEYNPNPTGSRVGDCAVRAIAKATGLTWDEAFAALSAQGYELCDLPSANHVWGAFLRRRGFVRRILPDDCPDLYTVKQFCADHPNGVYVLAVSGHVVSCAEGRYYDSWDSGNEVVLYYWKKRGSDHV